MYLLDSDLSVKLFREGTDHLVCHSSLYLRELDNECSCDYKRCYGNECQPEYFQCLFDNSLF
jgi:hypothetical protein